MKHIVVRRFKHISGIEYLGTLMVFDEEGGVLFSCKTMELSYKGNKASVSCVPQGIYEIVKEMSAAFARDLWEIKGVPYRSECKIHAANYASQLEGCIALGDSHTDIDGDGVVDVTNSNDTLTAFHNIMGNATDAIIEIQQGYGTV